MTAAFIYITTSSQEEARKIGNLLVEKRLAACVNIIPSMQSLFHWKGNIENADEAILIAKTREAYIPELTALVKKHHSYECPCIVALPIIGGNQDFIDWIEQETAHG